MSDEEDPKPKIVIPEALLAKFPEEEREELLKSIKEAFEDFDPENPPGELVEEISPGSTLCPLCGARLKILSRDQIVDDVAVTIYDCVPCDRAFTSSVPVQ